MLVDAVIDGEVTLQLVDVLYILHVLEVAPMAEAPFSSKVMVTVFLVIAYHVLLLFDEVKVNALLDVL